MKHVVFVLFSIIVLCQSTSTESAIFSEQYFSKSSDPNVIEILDFNDDGIDDWLSMDEDHLIIHLTKLPDEGIGNPYSSIRSSIRIDTTSFNMPFVVKTLPKRREFSHKQSYFFHKTVSMLSHILRLIQQDKVTPLAIEN